MVHLLNDSRGVLRPDPEALLGLFPGQVRGAGQEGASEWASYDISDAFNTVSNLEEVQEKSSDTLTSVPNKKWVLQDV